MDPEENRRQQIKLATRIARACEAGKPVDTSDVSELADLVLALNKWLIGGGFIPRAWSR